MQIPSLKYPPQSRPELFYEEEAGGFKFWVPTFISVRLQEIREDLYRERYAELHPEECAEGIDELKYSAWLRSRKGDRETDRVDLELLFIPQQALPANFLREEMISNSQLKVAQGFFKRPSAVSTSVPPASIGTTVTAPASAAASGQ